MEGTHAKEAFDQATWHARIEVENEMTLPGIAMLALVNLGQRQTRGVIMVINAAAFGRSILPAADPQIAMLKPINSASTLRSKTCRTSTTSR